jgi:hypothetical protein
MKQQYKLLIALMITISVSLLFLLSSTLIEIGSTTVVESNPPGRVSICHVTQGVGYGPAPITLNVVEPDVDANLGYGDTLGPCP